MAAIKTFISILYLLLYSCFCTADISPDQINQVDRGITLSKEFLEGIDNLSKALSESKKVTDTIQKVLKVFDTIGKVAASFGFIGALISFIFAFIPQEDPMLNFMKEQFAEVNRKLDSISIQIATLQTEMEWTDYASTYSKDENAIRNSWAKLKEFLESVPTASTQEQKTRLAERFTSFYENTGTESSVANLHRYITEDRAVSLNKNLLKLVIEKSNGNFNVLVQYSTYYTSLMVSGLKLNVFYYKLKGYDAEAKAKEAVTKLSDVLASIKDALIECVDDFEKWAQKDVVKFTTEKFSDTKTLASNIKDHLESKFHWYRWIVIGHSKDAENEFTFGKSIDLPVQEKAVIHVIYQEKGPSVEQRIKDKVKSSIETELKKIIHPSNDPNVPDFFFNCAFMKGELLYGFDPEVVAHIRFLHAVTEPSDYVQTSIPDIELNCKSLTKVLQIHRDFKIYLKSTTETPTCSNVPCVHGECKLIKDTRQGFCKCHKMFTGPTCEENIQNIVDYAAIEGEINGVIYQPVPDLAAIYFGVKDLKAFTKEIIESVRHDIQWGQVFVKYNEKVQKFRYINTLHNQLQMGNITQSQFVSEAGAQFTGGHTFRYYLTEFNHMMTGSGFLDKENLLDLFRKSLIHPGNLVVCSKDYRDQLDYFVRYMFALEKEAVLAWTKYLLITGNKGDIDLVNTTFHKFVSDQWRLYNKNGCGHLQAQKLTSFCNKPYYSTNQQQIKLNCHDNYKVFPETLTCSGGKWSAQPMCYTEPVNGRVECKTLDNGYTNCKAHCLPGWKTTTFSSLSKYDCIYLPCLSFSPPPCNYCTMDSVCKDHEVCIAGTCQDKCLVSPCGVNAKCTASNHRRTCTCVSPWKGDPYQGCKNQDLQWIQTTDVPYNAVLSTTRLAVCKATGPDGGWHSGYVNFQHCNFEWGWNIHSSKNYEVLVDPCEGRGWKWVEGTHNDMYKFTDSNWPGVGLYICISKSDGYGGKLFNTRSGFLCHIPNSNGYRQSSFYSLVPQPCI